MPAITVMPSTISVETRKPVLVTGCRPHVMPRVMFQLPLAFSTSQPMMVGMMPPSIRTPLPIGAR